MCRQGRAGQGRAGQGRAGQGRAGQGRITNHVEGHVADLESVAVGLDRTSSNDEIGVACWKS